MQQQSKFKIGHLLLLAIVFSSAAFAQEELSSVVDMRFPGPGKEGPVEARVVRHQHIHPGLLENSLKLGERFGLFRGVDQVHFVDPRELYDHARDRDPAVHERLEASHDASPGHDDEADLEYARAPG